MRTSNTAVLLCLGLLCGGAGVVQAQDKREQKESPSQRIERLIEELGHDSFEVRDSAQTQLETIGRAALPALQKAAQSEDPEVELRAREAIDKIQGVGGQGRTRERPEPQVEERRGREMPPMPIPDMDDLMKELERELPEFGKLFRQFFPGQEQDPDVDEERNGGNTRSRVKVWTFGNRPRRIPSGPTGQLGMETGRAGAALRAQLSLPQNEGLVVNQIQPGGYAEKHGIKLYDVIVAVDGRAVRTDRDLEPLNHKDCELELFRKAQLETLKLPPFTEAAPEPQAEPQKGQGEDKNKERSF